MKYHKQEKFKPFSNSHEILKQKKVAIIGLGGLGSHSSEYVTRMGIGSIVLVEDDFIEESNLPRQGLYTEDDSKNGRFKVDMAYNRLKEINSDVTFSIYKERLNEENIYEILKGVDLVLDGTDNMHTRYLINEFCFNHNIPWIYAAATGSVGVVSNFIPGKTPCFKCVNGDLGEDNTSCDSSGVILPALTLITSLQVTEAMKILLGHEPTLGETRFNIWTREETTISWPLDESCVVCQSKNKQHTEESKNKMYLVCNGTSIQVHTNYNLTTLSSMLITWGFSFERSRNELFIESFNSKAAFLSEDTFNPPRIVAFNNGKIVFHHISKEQIEKWLN